MDYVKILGAPSEEATTQTHELELPDGGNLFLLVTLHSKEPLATRIEAIRGAVNFLHHEISKKNFNFEDFRSSIEKTLPSLQFDAMCAYVAHSVVYLFAVGQVDAFLLRDGDMRPLLSGAEKIQSASGYLKKQDTLVLVTKAFLHETTLEELGSYVTKNKLTALESDTATRIQASEHRGKCGLLCISDNTEAPSEEESVEEEEILETETPPEDNTSSTPQPEAEAPNVFVRTRDDYEARRKSKRLAYVGLVLLLLLGISIYFGNKSRKAKAEEQAVALVISNAKEALNEAKSISSVNKGRARELILNARQEVLGVSTEGKYPELLSVKDALTQSLGEVAGIYEGQDTLFSDLTLISEDTKADSLVLSDDLIRVYSSSSSRMVTIELPGKRTETLAVSSLGKITEVAGYTTKTYVLTKDGIFNVANANQKLADLPGNQDDLLFESFAGNIYVVDKGQNQIWRFSGDGDAFSEKKEWLTADTNVDFSNTSGMGIDGSIWVYSSSGKLTKFTLGNPQTVGLRGLTESLSDRASFFTDSDTESLYFLDPSQESIFVFDKVGELIATYTSASLKDAKDLVVSEKNKLMIYAVGSKLYSISIQHIR